MMVFALDRFERASQQIGPRPRSSAPATTAPPATTLARVDTFEPSSGLPWSGRAGSKGPFFATRNTTGPDSPKTAGTSPETDSNFQVALEHTLRFEGGFSNHPNDAGGATMQGITQATYDSYRGRRGLTSKYVRNISEKEIRDIYYNDYWRASGADKIAQTNQPLAMVHFDTAVNMGPKRAERLLSQSQEDPHQYLRIREQTYRRFARARGQGVFLNGWLNRNNGLREVIAQLNNGSN